MRTTEAKRNRGIVTQADFHSPVPMGIAQNLQVSLDMCDGLEQEPISEIRTQTQELIATLRSIRKNRGGSQIRDAKTKASLINIIGRNGKMNKVLDGIQCQEEFHDQVLEAIIRIRSLAMRTLDIKRLPPPINNPLYKLWILEMTVKNSLGRELLQKIGEEFTGRPFTVRELAEALGRDPKDPTNAIRVALAELSARSRGADFELVIDQNEGEYKYFINPKEKRDMTKKEIKRETWINHVSPREGTKERELARHLMANLNIQVDENKIAEELGVSIKYLKLTMKRTQQRSEETDFPLVKRGKSYMLIEHPIAGTNHIR